MATRKELDDCTRAVIENGLGDRNMKKKELMEYLDMSPATFDRRMKDPGSLSLRELQGICRALQLDPVKRCELIAPMNVAEVKDFLLAMLA